MMADLHIPDAAYDAADQYLSGKSDDQDSLGAIDAAAPFIVAAELRRLADELGRLADSAKTPQIVVAGLHRAAYLLRKRVDELDPQGGA